MRRHDGAAMCASVVNMNSQRLQDKAAAIKNFKKSITLNPAQGVKANSEKFLKELGAM